MYDLQSIELLFGAINMNHPGIQGLLRMGSEAPKIFLRALCVQVSQSAVQLTTVCRIDRPPRPPPPVWFFSPYTKLINIGNL